MALAGVTGIVRKEFENRRMIIVLVEEPVLLPGLATPRD